MKSIREVVTGPFAEVVGLRRLEAMVRVPTKSVHWCKADSTLTRPIGLFVTQNGHSPDRNLAVVG
jgi:hypothetical protein